MSRRYECRCEQGGCSATPAGYRLLPRSTAERHKQGASVSQIAQGTLDAVLWPKVRTYQAEFMSHKGTNYDRNKLVFTPRVLEDIAGEPTLLSEILAPSDGANKYLLSYEIWNKQATDALLEISTQNSVAAKQAVALAYDLAAFYTRRFAQVLSQLDFVRNPDDPPKSSIGSQQISISIIEAEISAAVKHYRFPSGLIFKRAEDDPSGALLVPNDPNNASTLQQLRWVDAISTEIRLRHTEFQDNSLRIEELLNGLQEHRQNIIAHIDAKKIAYLQPFSVVETIYRKVYRPILIFSPAMVMIATMLYVLRIVHQLSTRSVNQIFFNLRQALLAFGVNKYQVNQMPEDPRSYQNIIDLTFGEQTVAVCPKCSAVYELTEEGVPKTMKCLYSATERSKKCGANLCRVVRGRLKPKLTFRRRKLNDWLANLLSRPSMITILDKAWERAQGPLPDASTDIWESSFIREMKGPAGDHLFSQVPENETRLLFSLSIDWFNPYHNRISGKNASSGVIVMTCLNLPPEERYKDENVYLVGILPGKKQQSRLDDFLDILVKELLLYWADGVYYVGIPGQTDPRLIRAALVQLICDLPAARKVAGFPGHSCKYNCSVCLAPGSQIMDFDSTHDPNMQRTRDDHLENAIKYREILRSQGKKAAEAPRSRESKWVRWSVLNDLPYWDPIKCTIEDSMHLILLGLGQFHWRRLWNGDNIPKSSETSAERDEGSSDEEDNELDHLNAEALNEENEDIEEIVEVEPTKRNSNDALLTSPKMRQARERWIYATDNSLFRLSIKQILCLLQENAGWTPSVYKSKAELWKILIDLRASFDHLPKPKRKLKTPSRLEAAMSKHSDSPLPLQSTVPMKSPSDRLINDFRPVKVPDIVRSDPQRTNPSFITKEELQAIQKDIEQIVVPSSVTKLQPNFGEKAHGKLKADEWKSLYTIYLPMTLTRLWAPLDSHRLHLKALLNLSLLVQIVISKTASKNGADLYDLTIENYLKLISVLYPGVKLVINHHLALHLSTFMRLHGPCRSHWAFPVERLIGKLQRIVKNAHIDDIPRTMVKVFTSQSILKALVAQGLQAAGLPRWQSPGERRKTSDTQYRISVHHLAQLSMIFGATASYASSMEAFNHGDATYRCSHTDQPVGDANIGYKSADGSYKYKVGTIKKILLISVGGTKQVVFLVGEYKPVPVFTAELWNAEFQHPALGLFLASTRMKGQTVIVPLVNVIGHVAMNRVCVEGKNILFTLQLTKDLLIRQTIFSR